LPRAAWHQREQYFTRALDQGQRARIGEPRRLRADRYESGEDEIGKTENRQSAYDPESSTEHAIDRADQRTLDALREAMAGERQRDEHHDKNRSVSRQCSDPV